VKRNVSLPIAVLSTLAAFTLAVALTVVAQTGTLFVENDNVGIGTATPAAPLHITESDGTTQILLQETSSTVAVRPLLKLENNGGARFEFENLATGVNWRMGHKYSDDSFVLTRVGSGITEFQVSKDGDLIASGTKNFVSPYPDQPGKKIYFAALEGPEAGTYYRGSAKLEGGVATIHLPDSFSKMTESAHVTVQLTPVGNWSQLFVAESSPSKLVIRAAQGAQDVEFHYLVQGIRKGYTDYSVVRSH
jgi:hypothetical protein